MVDDISYPLFDKFCLNLVYALVFDKFGREDVISSMIKVLSRCLIRICIVFDRWFNAILDRLCWRMIGELSTREN